MPTRKHVLTPWRAAEVALRLLQEQAETETHLMQVHAKAVAEASLLMVEGEKTFGGSFLPGGVTSHYSFFLSFFLF